MSDLTLSVTNFSSTQGFILTADPVTSYLEPRTAFGDFNADFLPDILMGAPFSNNATGGAYIIFGSSKMRVELLINLHRWMSKELFKMLFIKCLFIMLWKSWPL